MSYTAPYTITILCIPWSAWQQSGQLKVLLVSKPLAKSAAGVNPATWQVAYSSMMIFGPTAATLHRHHATCLHCKRSLNTIFAQNHCTQYTDNPNATEAALRLLLKFLCSHGTCAPSALGGGGSTDNVLYKWTQWHIQWHFWTSTEIIRTSNKTNKNWRQRTEKMQQYSASSFRVSNWQNSQWRQKWEQTCRLETSCRTWN